MKDKTNKSKECCEKCWITHFRDFPPEDNIITEISKPFCCNDSCPCHQVKREEDKIRLNICHCGNHQNHDFQKGELCPVVLAHCYCISCKPPKDVKFTKDFITKEIQKAKEATMKEVIEKIDGMNQTTAIAKPGRIEDQIDELNLKLKYDYGYNQALEDLKTLLTKEN